MMPNHSRVLAKLACVAIASMLDWVPGAAPAVAAQGGFIDNASEPFGSFGGVEYVRYTGRFAGATSLGEFRMPYEIIAPAIPELGNGIVVIEPPHFLFAPLGRDLIFGRDFLFGRGFSYASVGFSSNGQSAMEPGAGDLILAGVPLATLGLVNDEEILVQFTNALSTATVPAAALGDIHLRYASGTSQSGLALLETLHSAGGPGLFDVTLLNVPLWRAPFPPLGGFQLINGEFEPLDGVGRVMFVGTEGDQVLSDSEQYRSAADEPDYRVYEIAGAPHFASAANPLDYAMVTRAIFVAADAWMRQGIEPPPSTLIEADPSGAIDPVYGFVTGIARDIELNARGGVRFPDVEIARAQFIASDFTTAPLGQPGLGGAMVDLACEPSPGSSSGEPRFENHGQYVSRFVQQANALVATRILLPEDAAWLKSGAAGSQVGKPGTCGT